MTINPKCSKLLSVLLGGVCAGTIASCGDSESKYEGLIVEFKPVCQDEDIWLEGTIYNSTDKPIHIESGALPWQYDPIGTVFEATSSGKALAKKAVYPTIGRFGAKVLAPQERRSGATPIGFLFPEISGVLPKAPVTVSWKYLIGIEGAVEIARNPCDP